LAIFYINFILLIILIIKKNKIDYKGFENEYDLVNFGKELRFESAHYIHKKDILTLTKKRFKIL